MKRRFTIMYQGHTIMFRLNTKKYYTCKVTKPDGKKYHVHWLHTGIEAEWDDLAEGIYDMVRTIKDAR